MQDLHCGLFELPSYNVGLPYGFVRIMTQAARVFLFKSSSYSLIFFHFIFNIFLNIKNEKWNSLAYVNHKDSFSVPSASLPAAPETDLQLAAVATRFSPKNSTPAQGVCSWVCALTAY